MINPLIAYLFADPTDAEDYDGPAPSDGDTDRALRLLDDVTLAVEQARAVLAARSIERAVVGLALDHVRHVADELAEPAFEMHGMA